MAGVVAFFSAKDIPGENSFMPTNAEVVGINENEVIFVDIDMEVAFHGQPCGIILAKSMAIANSATAHVDIMYEKPQSERSINPTIFHWREKNKLSACNDTEVFTMNPNEKSKPSNLGDEKILKGEP